MATRQLALTKFQRLRIRLRGIPVFLYHGLTNVVDAKVPAREKKYWLSAAQFQAHLSQIHREGSQVVLLRGLWNRTAVLNHEKPLAVLTFDDGRASDYQIAYPLLLEADARAEFFVNTATIGEPGFLTWQQVSEMHRMGMSFQSHSHDHIDLSRLPARMVARQLRESKHRLEDRLGYSVDFLAAPYGILNNHIVEVAQEEGYRAVCNSRSWPALPGAPIVNRIAVYRHTMPREFHQLLARRPGPFAKRTARTTLIFLPKYLLLHFRSPQPGMCASEE